MPRLLPRDGAFSSFTWTTVFYLFVLIVPLAFFGTPTNAEVVEEEDWRSIIGIDLGTTYSSVGVMQNGTVEILVNDQGNRLTPSYVAFTDEERLIGDAAKNQYAANPHRTIFGIRRLIGRNFDDKDVQKDAKAFPFKVINKDGKPHVKVDINNSSKTLAPEEVCAMVLGKMKEIAEHYLGETITHAVVTVPAYFNDTQRQATKDAGAIAGLNVLRVVNEPTAAAIAYNLDKMGERDRERLIIVYDLGGSTFDVSLLSVEDGVFELFATAGDAYLGGEDFNHRVMDYFIKQYNNMNNVDITKDLKAIDKLDREVEKAKRTLSSQLSTRIEIEAFYNGRDFSETLTRAEFEELNIDLFKKTLKPVEQVLKDAKVKKSEVDHIILAGGSTRIPKVHSLVEGFFGGKKASNGINPDEVVAFGAAIQGDGASRPHVSCALPIMDLDAVKVTDWLEDNLAIASAEDFEAEDFEEHKEQLPSVAYPIIIKLYDSALEHEEPLDHHEL